MQQIMQNDLLTWFDGDSRRLEDFRRRLVFWFGKQGCRAREECEDQAQKTFLRAMQILARKPEICQIAPEQYITGVAKYILRENPVPKLIARLPDDDESIAEAMIDAVSGEAEDAILDKLEMEQRLKCLKSCMQKLAPEERELVELYSQSDKHYSKNLIEKFGGTRNALRLRIFHAMRGKLAPCMEACVKFAAVVKPGRQRTVANLY